MAAEKTKTRPVSEVVSLRPGTSVLVTAPVMTGKRRLMQALLAADSSSRQTAIITTRKAGDAVEREFRTFADPEAERPVVIDCVSRTGGFGPSRSSTNRRYVSDPGDLTGVGIALTKFMRRFHETDGDGRIGLHSLSTMLMYADLKRVFQFLHVVTGRISALDFTGVFTLDDAVVSDRERDIVLQSFDAVVELRERETPELRVRGADYGPREWTPVRLAAADQ